MSGTGWGGRPRAPRGATGGMGWGGFWVGDWVDFGEGVWLNGVVISSRLQEVNMEDSRYRITSHSETDSGHKELVIEDTSLSGDEGFVGLITEFDGDLDWVAVRLFSVEEYADKVFSKKTMLEYVTALKDALESSLRSTHGTEV